MKHQTHNSMPNLVLFLSKALILEEVLEEHDTKKESPFQSNAYFKRTRKRMYGPACCWRALKSELEREGTKGAHTTLLFCWEVEILILLQQAADLPHLSLSSRLLFSDKLCRPLLTTFILSIWKRTHKLQLLPFPLFIYLFIYFFKAVW